MSQSRTTRILPSSPEAIVEAAAVLRAGGLVAFPTETVYGLGASAADARAVAALYVAKGRPSFNPLIAHIADEIAARALARFNDEARRLAHAFWPGPLTLVLPKTDDCPVSELATAGLDSVALRVPKHEVAQSLLRVFGGAIVAPSANRSGHVSPTTAQHVAADLEGRIDLIIDGGAVAVGLESTIVGCLGKPCLLRPGGVPRSAIEAVLGAPLRAAESAEGEATLAPGMLASHYAPRASLRLNARDVMPGEAVLAFGEAPRGAAQILNLSVSASLEEAASRLFGYLRALDAAGADKIAVMPIPEEGIGEAINDRLRRAAAPRDTP
jgi:L-threonylcarbamoyladenylate synthase